MAAARFVDRHVPTVMARIARRLERELEVRFSREWGVRADMAVWRTMSALVDVPSESVTRLAATCLLQQPTMTKLLDRLVRDGLVRRSESPRDRRVVEVSLTAAGTALAERMLAIAETHEGDLLGRYPALAGLGLPETLAAMIQEEGL